MFSGFGSRLAFNKRRRQKEDAKKPPPKEKPKHQKLWCPICQCAICTCSEKYKEIEKELSVIEQTYQMTGKLWCPVCNCALCNCGQDYKELEEEVFNMEKMKGTIGALWCPICECQPCKCAQAYKEVVVKAKLSTEKSVQRMGAVPCICDPCKCAKIKAIDERVVVGKLWCPICRCEPCKCAYEHREISEKKKMINVKATDIINVEEAIKEAGSLWCPKCHCYPCKCSKIYDFDKDEEKEIEICPRCQCEHCRCQYEYEKHQDKDPLDEDIKEGALWCPNCQCAPCKCSKTYKKKVFNDPCKVSKHVGRIWCKMCHCDPCKCSEKDGEPLVVSQAEQQILQKICPLCQCDICKCSQKYKGQIEDDIPEEDRNKQAGELWCPECKCKPCRCAKAYKKTMDKELQRISKAQSKVGKFFCRRCSCDPCICAIKARAIIDEDVETLAKPCCEKCKCEYCICAYKLTEDLMDENILTIEKAKRALAKLCPQCKCDPCRCGEKGKSPHEREEDSKPTSTKVDITLICPKCECSPCKCALSFKEEEEVRTLERVRSKGSKGSLKICPICNCDPCRCAQKFEKMDEENIPTIDDAKKTLEKLWFLLCPTCKCEPCVCAKKFKDDDEDIASVGELWCRICECDPCKCAQKFIKPSIQKSPILVKDSDKDFLSTEIARRGVGQLWCPICECEPCICSQKYVGPVDQEIVTIEKLWCPKCQCDPCKCAQEFKKYDMNIQYVEQAEKALEMLCPVCQCEPCHCAEKHTEEKDVDIQSVTEYKIGQVSGEVWCPICECTPCECSKEIRKSLEEISDLLDLPVCKICNCDPCKCIPKTVRIRDGKKKKKHVRSLCPKCKKFPCICENLEEKVEIGKLWCSVCTCDPCRCAQKLKEFDGITVEEARATIATLWFSVCSKCKCKPCLCAHTYKVITKEDLWTSPSDLIENLSINAIKPPYTRKYVQAYTHKAILEIGYHVERRVLRTFMKEKQLALEDQQKYLTEAFNASILEQIKDAEAKERATCDREIEKLTEEFETNLINSVNDLQKELGEGFAEYIVRHDEALKENWENKLKQEVEETTKRITLILMNELCRQEEILAMFFQAELTKKELEKEFDLEKQQIEYKKNLLQTKQRLECKNIANMMYVLCMERRKCLEEKFVIEEYYQDKMLQLKKKVSCQKKIIKDLKREIKHKIRESKLRETCIEEVIKQFQKYINFAIRACPTQGQFLLSLEKLMTFELAQQPKFAKGSEVTESSKTCPPSRKPRPCNPLIPWPYYHAEFREYKDIPGIKVDDYHDCLNELAMPKNPEELELPAFTYHDHMYVREDFRNLISCGIHLTPSHDLWSEDVELLYKTLRESVIIEKKSDLRQQTSREFLNALESAMKITSHADDHKRDSILRFDFSHQYSYNTHQPGSKNAEPHERVKRGSLKQTMALDETTLSATAPNFLEANPQILGTVSSVELLIEKGKIKRMEHFEGSFDEIEETIQTEVKESGENEKVKNIHISEAVSIGETVSVASKMAGLREIKGSDVTLTKSIQMVSDKSLDVNKIEALKPKLSGAVPSQAPEGSKRKTSKIYETRDSVEYLRQSRQELLEPAVCNICHKKRTARYDSQSSNLGKPYCCEICSKKRASNDVSVSSKVKPILPLESEPKVKRLSVEVKSEFLSTYVSPDDLEVFEIEEFYPEKLSKIYTTKQTKRITDKKKKFVSSGKKRTLPMKQKEELSSESLASDDMHTNNRLKSLINVISDNPNLIKLFTACQR